MTWLHPRPIYRAYCKPPTDIVQLFGQACIIVERIVPVFVLFFFRRQHELEIKVSRSGYRPPSSVTLDTFDVWGLDRQISQLSVDGQPTTDSHVVYYPHTKVSCQFSKQWRFYEGAWGPWLYQNLGLPPHFYTRPINVPYTTYGGSCSTSRVN